jgi:hypothetical protein
MRRLDEFGVVMRFLAPLICALLAGSSAALASDGTSCRTEANMAADEWAKGNLIDGGEAAAMEPAPLVIIAYGRKYGVARNAMDRETLRPRALGALVRERNLVYREELDRCLGRFTVKIVGSHLDVVKRITSH